MSNTFMHWYMVCICNTPGSISSMFPCRSSQVLSSSALPLGHLGPARSWSLCCRSRLRCSGLRKELVWHFSGTSVHVCVLWEGPLCSDFAKGSSLISDSIIITVTCSHFSPQDKLSPSALSVTKADLRPPGSFLLLPSSRSCCLP